MKQAKYNSQPRHIAWKARSIEALKPEPARYIAWAKDGDGKGVRVTPRAVKSFILAYRFEGRARMLTLDKTYPTLSLASAGRRYADAQHLLDEGIDPGVKVVADKRAEREAETVKELVDLYLKHAARTKRSWREDERILHKELVARWKTRKAKDITRRDIIELLDEIVERGAPISANRTLASVRKMFNWALSRDVLPSSPAVAIEAPGKETARDRALDEEEIRAFWTRLDETDMKEGTRIALQLILATAQRPGEVVGAEWVEMDLSNGWWEIPGAKTKNGRVHRVPLHSTSIGLIKRLAALNGTERWLFPTVKDKHLRADALPQAVANNRAVFDLDHFTPHDLRRSAATQMIRAGIPRDTVGKILNHTENGVTAKHYDKYDYDKEKVAAMRKWGRKLERIIAGQADDKVVRIA